MQALILLPDYIRRKKMKKFTTQLLFATMIACFLFGNLAVQSQDNAGALEKGVQNLYAEDYQKAINNFQKAKAENSDDGIVYYYLGYAYTFVNQPQKAKENLQKAKKLFNSQGNEEGVKAAEGVLKTLK